VGVPRIASDIAGRQLLAAENWRAKPYPGRVCLLKAESGTEFFSDDPALGWSKVLSNLQVVSVPGDHGTINTGMNLKILARKLNAAFDESRLTGDAGSSVVPARLGSESAQPLPEN
jgi:thioesterase domain-containing protein